MSNEKLDITITESTPFGDGTYYQEELVNVSNLNDESYFSGDSEEFLNSAGCNICPVKDAFSEQGHCRLSKNTTPTPGRKLTYNLHLKSGYFPCQRRYFGW
jgi:hypothetical protein